MAITSKTDICNLSQDLLSGSTVQDIDNPSNALESLLQRWYDHCRRKVLREHTWKFATKRAILAASSTEPLFGYETAFPVPNDFVRLLRVETDEGQIVPPYDYQLESNDGILSVLTNSEADSLRLVYIYDITDVTRFDALFTSYLALEIALSVAQKMTESNTKTEIIARLHKSQGALAKSVSGQERPPSRVERSFNRDARRSLGSTRSDRIMF